MTFLNRILEEQGIEAAYKAACDIIRKMDSDMQGFLNSRFFELRVLEDGSKKLWPTIEAAISRAYDSHAADGEPIPEYFYCAPDGRLHPLTVSEPTAINPDEETPFYHAAADLVAGGEVVGVVLYTDH